jgi:uncharacterized paraquat-inducible protein A
MNQNKLIATCEKLYAEKGATAVYDYINANHRELDWYFCQPCDTDTPATNSLKCLVCGSAVNQKQDKFADFI